MWRMMKKKLKNEILFDQLTLLVDLKIQVTLPNRLVNLNWYSQLVGGFYLNEFFSSWKWVKISINIWIGWVDVLYSYLQFYQFI